MATALDRLISESDIRAVLARYCRGVDRCDLETIRSVYHDDGIDDHGIFVGRGWDFAEVVVKSHLDDSVMTQHVISSPLIAVTGDVAHVETYCVAYRWRQKREKELLNSVGGRYVDRFERRAGDWRIAYRIWTRDWGKIDVVTREFPREGFNNATRDRDDAAFLPVELIGPGWRR